jgi:PAS domain S-box-containing protein
MPREQLLGHLLGERFPHFPGSERFQTYRQVCATREPCRSEDFTDPQAWSDSPLAARVLDIVIAPMGDDLVVSARDISERKRAEQDLRLRAELLDLAHDAVIVREPTDSRVRFWNREAEAIYGFSRAEALDRITHDLLKTVWPESLQAADEALERDGQWVGELRHTCKDGRVITVSSRQALKRGC